MTTADRKAVRILRIAKCLEMGDPISAREQLPELPVSLIVESVAMVRSILVDPAKRGEFARATASRLLKIQSEFRAAPNMEAVEKYFSRG